MRYTEFSNFTKLPKSRFDDNRRGNRFLEPKPMTIAALHQFDRPFGMFVQKYAAERFIANIYDGDHGRANLIGDAAVIEQAVENRRLIPSMDGKAYLAQVQLSFWGKHARLWLDKGCVYDMDRNLPDHALTERMYENLLHEAIIPDYVFRSVSSLPNNTAYVSLKNRMMQFKLAATENAGMYEMR